MTDNKSVYPPPDAKQPIPLNTVHTKPLDKVQAEPTPRKS